jgi:hypothetical protein
MHLSISKNVYIHLLSETCKNGGNMKKNQTIITVLLLIIGAIFVTGWLRHPIFPKSRSRPMGAMIALFVLLTVVINIPIACAENVTNGINYTNLTANTAVDPSEPFITIDPPGDHKIGDVFFINGTTNLPTCENLSMDMADDRTYHANSDKSYVFTAIPGKYVSIPHISIVPDARGTNLWSVNVTDSVRELNASEYTITVWYEFNVSPNSPACPNGRASIITFLTLYPANSTIITDYSTTQTPVQRSLTETQTPSGVKSLPAMTPSSPLSAGLSIVTIGAIVLLNFIWMKKRD